MIQFWCKAKCDSVSKNGIVQVTNCCSERSGRTHSKLMASSEKELVWGEVYKRSLVCVVKIFIIRMYSYITFVSKKTSSAHIN